MLTPAEVRQFIEGRTVFAFDPAMRKPAAVVTYGTEGRCAMRMVSGETDQGRYGFDADCYWTRYDTFRGGQTHAFRLERLGPGVVQAWFATGTRAFVQSHDAKPTAWPDLPQG